MAPVAAAHFDDGWGFCPGNTDPFLKCLLLDLKLTKLSTVLGEEVIGRKDLQQTSASGHEPFFLPLPLDLSFEVENRGDAQCMCVSTNSWHYGQQLSSSPMFLSPRPASLRTPLSTSVDPRNETQLVKAFV